MLNVTSTVVVSGTDWAAIVASISTGVAAVAGIGGTLWQASRNWNQEDKRAKAAEKRRVYAACLAAFNTGIQTAVYREAFRGSSEGSSAVREHDAALLACLTLVSELTLIAPSNIGRLGGKMLVELNHYPGKDRTSATRALSNLIKAMRADLGEPPLTEDLDAEVPEAVSTGILDKQSD
jgi:hypothetical protein